MKYDSESERDPIPACGFCEYATEIHGDTHFVFCTKEKQDMSVLGDCPLYRYDLLKRKHEMNKVKLDFDENMRWD